MAGGEDLGRLVRAYLPDGVSEDELAPASASACGLDELDALENAFDPTKLHAAAFGYLVAGATVSHVRSCVAGDSHKFEFHFEKSPPKLTVVKKVRAVLTRKAMPRRRCGACGT